MTARDLSVSRRRVAIGALVLAALLAAVSLGGLLWPAAYARETLDWRAQALSARTGSTSWWRLPGSPSAHSAP